MKMNKVLDDVNLHLWQQRNFSRDGESFDLHKSNVAQMLSVSSAYENNESLISALLRDEMDLCCDKSLYIQQEKSTILNDQKYESILNIESNSHIKFVNSLLSHSSCDSPWLKEIEQNPTTRLIQTNSFGTSQGTLFSKSNYHNKKQSKLHNNLPEQNFKKNNVFHNHFSAATSQSTSDLPPIIRDAKRKHDDLQELNEDGNFCFESVLDLSRCKLYARLLYYHLGVFSKNYLNFFN